MNDCPDGIHESENPRKKICSPKASVTSETACHSRGCLTSDKACQTEEPWNTIIVNQIPMKVDYEKLISLFSQYGSIKNTWICKKTGSKWEGSKTERIARITFTNEDDAFKVWKASQEKLVKYNEHVLMITLASDDYSPIQNLPDICLCEIFRCLDWIQDKFNIELVCKRWRDNGRCSWSNITKIHSYIWDIKTWRVILPRVANSLKDIELFVSENGQEEFLQAVASEPCIDLKSFDCGFFDVNYALFGPHINQIIQQSRNLHQIELSPTSVSNFDMNFIDLLPIGIEEIEVHVCRDENISLTAALSRLQNLRVLRLDGLVIDNHQMIDDVVSLERLSLLECNIPDSIFSTILRNNRRLKYLNIDHLNDTLAMCIRRLPALQVLVIHSDDFTDAQLAAIGPTPSLKYLYCYQCPAITDEGIQSFFNSTSTITQLCIEECSITPQSIVIAREWTERTGKCLKFFVEDYLFDKNSELDLQDTEKFQAIGFDDDPSERPIKIWGLELIE